MSFPENTSLFETSEAASLSPALLHGRVLIGLEDDAQAEQFREALTKAGSEVIVTSGGMAVLEALVTEEPELLLLDMALGHTETKETVRQVKGADERRYLPVVIVLAEGAEPEPAIDAGADDVLRLPVHPSELALRVRMLLRLSRMHQDLVDNNSELQAAYETARESEAKYRALIHDAQDALVLVDPQSSAILEANRRALELSGYANDDVIGQPITMLCAQMQPDAWQKIMEEARVSGHASLAEGFVQRKDGEVVPVELYVSLASHHLGEPLIQVLARDVRPRKQLETERTKSERLAAVVETAVTVNHEINNPLLVITSSVETLQRSLFNAESNVREKLERINEACGRIQRFTQQLAQVIEPVSKEYLPGMKMLDIQQSVAPGASAKTGKTPKR